MLAKLTAVQAATLIAARGTSDANRKDVKRRVFAEAKAANGIPNSVKLRVELDDLDSPDYLVLRNKVTGAAIGVSNAQGTATPLPTPATVNQADVAADTRTDAPPAPGVFRFVTVKRSDVFFSAANDFGVENNADQEVIVRVPA